jgi:hypothetical protein
MALALAGCAAEPDYVEDLGDFVPRYEASASAPELEAALRDARYLEDVTQALNDAFALPHDVPVILSDCGEANAYYVDRTIVLCYELVEEMAAAFRDDGLSPEEYAQAVDGAVTFVLLHELGHAFVDIYDIPITGKEEDAVDDFGAILLINTAGAAQSVLYAAGFWAKGTDESPSWDVHSLDSQRAYQLICIVYGSDPAAFAHLVGDPLPEERAESCPEEYEQKSRAWAHLTAAFAK